CHRRRDGRHRPVGSRGGRDRRCARGGECAGARRRHPGHQGRHSGNRRHTRRQQVRPALCRTLGAPAGRDERAARPRASAGAADERDAQRGNRRAGRCDCCHRSPQATRSEGAAASPAARAGAGPLAPRARIAARCGSGCACRAGAVRPGRHRNRPSRYNQPSPENMIEAPICQNILDLPGSRIRVVSRASADIPDLIKLWFGEGDEPTPEFVRRGAAEALARGETFYAANRGIAPLLDAIAGYPNRAYGVSRPPERMVATAQARNAVVIAPIWPNGRAAMKAMGGEVRDVFLRAQEDGRWKLDLDELFAACDETTRLIMINSPGNPTGWVASEAELKAILDFCRERGIWILSDEVYGRIIYNGARHA